MRYLFAVMISMILISGCAGLEKNFAVNSGEEYQNISFNKLSNLTFIYDYRNKLVKFDAKYGGVISPLLYVENTTGVSLCGLEPSDGCFNYNIINKNKYDFLTSLKNGTLVEVKAREYISDGDDAGGGITGKNYLFINSITPK